MAFAKKNQQQSVPINKTSNDAKRHDDNDANVNFHKPLERKSKDPKVLERLFEIEREIIERARRNGIV